MVEIMAEIMTVVGIMTGVGITIITGIMSGVLIMIMIQFKTGVGIVIINVIMTGTGTMIIIRIMAGVFYYENDHNLDHGLGWDYDCDPTLHTHTHAITLLLKKSTYVHTNEISFVCHPVKVILHQKFLRKNRNTVHQYKCMFLFSHRQ